MADNEKESNYTPNQKPTRTSVGKGPTKPEDRPGSSPEQPANADYDYRPDEGESGGGEEHNPELDKESLKNTSSKKPEKPKTTR